jgi:hypothetical protein
MTSSALGECALVVQHPERRREERDPEDRAEPRPERLDPGEGTVARSERRGGVDLGRSHAGGMTARRFVVKLRSAPCGRMSIAAAVRL